MQLLADDIQTLQGLESRDYDRSSTWKTVYSRRRKNPVSHVNPQEHRAEIMKLPENCPQQREANEKLASLREPSTSWLGPIMPWQSRCNVTIRKP